MREVVQPFAEVRPLPCTCPSGGPVAPPPHPRGPSEQPWFSGSGNGLPGPWGRRGVQACVTCAWGLLAGGAGQGVCQAPGGQVCSDAGEAQKASWALSPLAPVAAERSACSWLWLCCHCQHPGLLRQAAGVAADRGSGGRGGGAGGKGWGSGLAGSVPGFQLLGLSPAGLAGGSFTQSQLLASPSPPSQPGEGFGPLREALAWSAQCWGCHCDRVAGAGAGGGWGGHLHSARLIRCPVGFAGRSAGGGRQV